MKNIADMTTAEMVAEYNALTGKSIKKFSSREAGDKQLTAARKATSHTSQLAAEKATKYPVADQTKFHMVNGREHCPVCGTTEVYAGEGDGAGMVVHEDSVFGCHHCGWEVNLRKRTKAINPIRSKGISESWNDPEIAAKRAQRNAVSVEGKGFFRSTLQAFEKLGLPYSKHIKFRIALKQAGALDFQDGKKVYKFTLVKQEELNA